MTMQDANYKYRMEYSQSDGWSGWKDAGQSFYDLATAVHYFHRESSSNRDRIYRVTDMTGDMVYNGKFAAKIIGAVLNEETGTASTRAMNYFVEYQAEPDWPWMPVIETGTNNIATGTADQAMALMMQIANQNPGHAHRIKDAAGHIVLDAKPHSIKTQETKKETPTMTYTVQWQDKDGKWYLDRDDFQSAFLAFNYVREMDDEDETCGERTVPRRIIRDDVDKIESYGRHRPISASERPKQKPFWIVTDGRPKTQYSSLAEACMAATTNAGLVATRYIFQAVRVIDWREEEIGE